MSIAKMIADYQSKRDKFLHGASIYVGDVEEVSLEYLMKLTRSGEINWHVTPPQPSWRTPVHVVLGFSEGFTFVLTQTYDWLGHHFEREERSCWLHTLSIRDGEGREVLFIADWHTSWGLGGSSVKLLQKERPWEYGTGCDKVRELFALVVGDHNRPTARDKLRDAAVAQEISNEDFHRRNLQL